MQRQLSSTFLPIYLTALVVFLTWASLVQGAAIHRDASPLRRDLAAGPSSIGLDFSNDEILRRDDIASTGNSDGLVKDTHTLPPGPPRATGDEEIVEDDDDLSRRWYTLIEIAESPESD